jgi:UPF0755 protein
MNLKEVLSFSKSELLYGILAFSVTFLLVFGSRQLRLSSDESLIFSEETRLVVPERFGLEDLGMALDSLQVDYNTDELVWSARLLGWRYFQRGSYLLEGEYSYEELLSKLARGIQDPVPVVILPGIDQNRFAEAVSNQVGASEQELYSVITDSTFLDDLGYSEQELFGRMLPETYLIYWTTSPKDIIRRVLREFDSKVEDQFSEDITERDLSVDEVLTMASIVEWEAKIEEEKPIIAGLYWNRLDRRMMLQADPTVNYALGERRRLLFEDYRFEHPYNTYVNRGLPPGPITNPSLSTIEATIFPQQHDYLYMVANPEGGHIFTRTFQEHQVESEKWRRWLRQQYRIKRQQEAEGSR